MRGAPRYWLLAGVAVVLAGLVYVNALHNPFVYDDRRLVVENRSLRSPLDLRGIVLHEVTRPVVNLSYAIDRAIWGPAPFGFHITNVLLHMPPSSTVVECFSPVHVNPSILQICRVLGHSYHQVVARSHLISPYAFGRECLVDCDHLRLVLDRL